MVASVTMARFLVEVQQDAGEGMTVVRLKAVAA